MTLGADIRDQIGIITEAEFAEAIGVRVETLATWRTERRGPDYVKFGKSVFYCVDHIQRYATENAIRLDEAGIERAVELERDRLVPTRHLE